MTAAAAWEDAGDALPKEIATALNSSSDESLQDLKLLAAIPEWEVSLEGGETASHTDGAYYRVLSPRWLCELVSLSPDDLYLYPVADP